MTCAFGIGCRRGEPVFPHCTTMCQCAGIGGRIGTVAVLREAQRQRTGFHDRVAGSPVRQRLPGAREPQGSRRVRQVRRHRGHRLQRAAVSGQGAGRPAVGIRLHRGGRGEQPVRRLEQRHQPARVQARRQAGRQRASLRPWALRVPVWPACGDAHRGHRRRARQKLRRKDRQPRTDRLQLGRGGHPGRLDPRQAVDDAVQPHHRQAHRVHDARGHGG